MWSRQFLLSSHWQGHAKLLRIVNITLSCSLGTSARRLGASSNGGDVPSAHWGSWVCRLQLPADADPGGNGTEAPGLGCGLSPGCLQLLGDWTRRWQCSSLQHMAWRGEGIKIQQRVVWGRGSSYCSESVSQLRVPLWILAAPLSNLASLGACHQCECPDGLLDSRVWPGTALAVAGFRGVSQQMQDFCSFT